MVAWTLHFEKLGVNLFLTGDNETGTVTGRLFEENVKEMGGNFFYADVVRGKEAKRRSMAEFAEDDPLDAISAFYKHSEQRGVRAVQTGEETYALLTEHPDCDEAWFNSITPKDLAAVDTLETVVPMERRLYRWFCGCNQQRMLQVVAPIYREGPEELFAGDPSLEMRCPRCAARHIVTREAMEAYVHKEPGK